MKYLFNFFLKQSLIVMLLYSSFASAQTFQNTFLPVHEDNYVAGVAVNKAYWVIGNTNSFAPAVGTEHILFSKYTMTGASAFDRKYYGAPNTIAFTSTDIQAGWSQFANTPGNSVPPLPCSFSVCSGAGLSVLSLSAPNSKNYFYVSGYYKDPVFGVRRLLVMQLSPLGAINWARTNLLSAASVYDEMGISVESCPNGDVIVVSSVTGGNGITYPAVTRIDNAGNIRWRFHYPPATFEQPYNFIPHQSCMFKEKVTGLLSTPTGIAITGECNKPGVAGSSFFVMRVAYNGALIWKFNYPLATSSPSHDIGWDIMTEADPLGAAGVVDNFIVTGLANTSGVGPVVGAIGFASRVSATTGAFVNCYRFGIPSTTQTTYGQGIYQSMTAPSNVVITGGTDDPAAAIFTDTYLYEMNITTGAQVSGHHYSLTTPNYPRTESVVAVGSAYPTPGYFISTNSNNTYGATLTDAHVIKTDVFGSVNSANCHSDTLVFIHDSISANANSKCVAAHCDTIINLAMTSKTLNAPHVLCYSATRLTDDPSGDGGMLNNGSINIYPNPASGAEVTIEMELPLETGYVLQLINSQGKVLREVNNVLEKGSNAILLNIEGLPAGVYLVRLSNGNAVYNSKFINIK